MFTTRRILGKYSGEAVELSALAVVKDRFGNFKGDEGKETEVMTLQTSEGSDAKLEYETFIASMAPIYYLKFWKCKYPVLEKLKTDPTS